MDTATARGVDQVMIGDKSWRPFEPCAENQVLALFNRYPWMRYVIGLLAPVPKDITRRFSK